MIGHPKDCCTMAKGPTIQDTPFVIGEERYTSAGNVFRLIRWSDRTRVLVQRVSQGDGRPNESWDKDMLFRWTDSQWESIPLVGQKSDDPTFGLFIP
jgi:hypothetical protein